jgi:hypothetical protein
MHQGGAGDKRGRRDSLVALKFVDELYDLQVLVVDDYHREEVKISTDDILLTRKDEQNQISNKLYRSEPIINSFFLTKNKQKNLKNYLMNYVLMIFHYLTINNIKNI